MRVLLDANVDPRRISDFLEDADVVSPRSIQRAVSDRQRLRWAVDNGLSLYVTVDKNLPHQQTLSSFAVGLVWFDVHPTTLEGLQPHTHKVNHYLPVVAQTHQTRRVRENEGTLFPSPQE